MIVFPGSVGRVSSEDTLCGPQSSPPSHHHHHQHRALPTTNWQKTPVMTSTLHNSRAGHCRLDSGEDINHWEADVQAGGLDGRREVMSGRVSAWDVLEHEAVSDVTNRLIDASQKVRTDQNYRAPFSMLRRSNICKMLYIDIFLEFWRGF